MYAGLLVSHNKGGESWDSVVRRSGSDIILVMCVEIGKLLRSVTVFARHWCVEDAYSREIQFVNWMCLNIL